MLHLFLSHPDARKCTRLTRVICSGEALSKSLQNEFFEALPESELHNLYGPTEAAVDVTAWQCHREDPELSVPIGRPVANTQIYILDEHGQHANIGVPGELHIGGVQVARGYLNQPDLTDDKFVADPFSQVEGARLYKTGDLAKYRNDGVIEYLGRNDFQVKIRGLRIELGEIESALSTLPEVKQAVVMAREDRENDQRLVAYCASGDSELTGPGIAPSSG